MLRPFRIRPRSVRVGDETAKGYRVEQFEDAFARYLPLLSESVTSVTSVTTAPLSQADVTDVVDVTLSGALPTIRRSKSGCANSGSSPVTTRTVERPIPER